MKHINLSLFWKFFITYLISILLFLGVQIYSTNQTSSLWQESYTTQIESSLINNAQDLSDRLSNFYYLPQNMNISDDFNFLKKEAKINSAQHSRSISWAMNDISNQISFFTLSDVIVHLQKSDLCITPSSFYLSLDEWNTHYKYENTDIIDMLSRKKAKNTSLEMLPSDSLAIRGSSASPYVTCIMKESSDTCSYIFLIEEQQILDCFQLSSLPETMYFQLYDEYHNILLESGSIETKSGLRKEKFLTFTADVPAINATASISIPQSYFKSVTKRAQNIANIILCMSLLLGLLLSFAFSWMNTKPVRSIIQSKDLPNERQSKNELVTILNYLSEAEEQRRSMHGKLLSTFLIRAFSGFPVSSDDFAEIVKDGAPFPMPARVAVARYRTSRDNQEFQRLMFYQFKEHLSSDFIIEPLNNQEIGLVFTAENEVIFKLKDYLDEINRELEIEDQLICGVSAPFASFDEITTAVRQAFFSLPTYKDSFVIFTDMDSTLSSRPQMPDYKEFQSALFNWNKKKIDTLLQEYANAVMKARSEVAQEVFYTLLTTIREAADTVKGYSDIFDGIGFKKSISGDANIRSLSSLTNYLFEMKTLSQSDEKKLRNEEIVNYIDTHFSDPLLSVAVIAEMYDRSERTINTIMNEETGMSFSSYLAGIRMQKAGEMLRETPQEIVVIAEKCGLTMSTFYRNFKKHYHMTPAEYKAQFSNSTYTNSPENQ